MRHAGIGRMCFAQPIRWRETQAVVVVVVLVANRGH